MSADLINPDYYVSSSGLKVYEVIEAFKLGFYEGTALAYILRSGKKGPAKDDLRKAIWNLERIIATLPDED